VETCRGHHRPGRRQPDVSQIIKMTPIFRLGAWGIPVQVWDTWDRGWWSVPMRKTPRVPPCMICRRRIPQTTTSPILLYQLLSLPLSSLYSSKLGRNWWVSLGLLSFLRPVFIPFFQKNRLKSFLKRRGLLKFSADSGIVVEKSVHFKTSQHNMLHQAQTHLEKITVGSANVELSTYVCSVRKWVCKYANQITI
jgi:hypothetical protein